MANKTIFITAGHSLNQAGASAKGLKEERLTIEMRDLIASQLREWGREWGYEVVTDNDKDSLSTVISKIKKEATSNDILLDIHFNAASSNAKGTECFVSANSRVKSVRISERIAELTAGMLNTPNRGVKKENESQHNRLGILHTAASSVLWEVEFITNAEFMDNYQEMKQRLAVGVANILVQELNK